MAALFDAVQLSPDRIRTVDDLALLPVTSKENLVELQRANPPFGHFLGTAPDAVRRIYISPGPIYEPEAPSAAKPNWAVAFEAAGIGPGDIVLNTWSYHLVPAGLVLDEAFVSLGATVVPAGPGNKALLAQAILEVGVTVVAGSTAFFEELVEIIADGGAVLPRDWRVRAAFLGGEFGDWSAKRRALEHRLQIRTFTAYGTSDVGLIGFECTEQNGYHVGDAVIVQICDENGRPVPDGEPGEVVVTSLNPVWPMIRLGTGDASYLQGEPCPCGRATPRIAPLLGRTRQSLKIREIFVYPRHIDAIRTQVHGVAKAQGRARRRDGRDEIDLVVESELPLNRVEIDVRSIFESLARVRAGTVSVVSPGTIQTIDLLVDERE